MGGFVDGVGVCVGWWRQQKLVVVEIREQYIVFNPRMLCLRRLVWISIELN